MVKYCIRCGKAHHRRMKTLICKNCVGKLTEKKYCIRCGIELGENYSYSCKYCVNCDKNIKRIKCKE